MESGNRLTLTYLQQYPGEAARTLERLPASIVTPFLEQIEPATAARVLDPMLPEHAGAMLAAMSASRAAGILERMSVSPIARLIHTLDKAAAGRLMELLPLRNRLAVRHLLKHPPYTVGAVMDTVHFVLSDNLTVGDALRRLKRYRNTVNGDIFVVDSTHRLVGGVAAAALLKADPRTPVQRVMRQRPPTLHARTRLAASAAHAGWRKYRLLPVVEGDYTLVGSIDYETVLNASSSERSATETADPFGVMLDLARLYWISVASLLETLTAGYARRKA